MSLTLPSGYIGWSIKALSGAQAGNEQSAAAWGLEALVLTLKPTSTDTLTFSSGVADATVTVFSYGDTLALYYNGPAAARTRWFVGVVTKPTGNLAPASEVVTYEVSSLPWYFMSRLAMQALYSATTPGSPTTVQQLTKPLALLGIPAGPTNTSLNGAVTAALEYAIACGAIQSTGAIVPFTLGTIGVPSMVVPYESMSNLSVAQFIQACLRWCPDCAVTVDYSEPTPGAAPTLNIFARSSAPAVTLPISGGAMSGLSRITPRNDLLVGGVVLKYDAVNTVDGTNYLYLSEDVYPPGTLDTDAGVMVAYFDLQGGSETFQSCTIETQTRPISSSDSEALPWVKKHMPWMFGLTGGAPTGGAGSVSPTVYDVSGIGIANISTIIDPSDPQAGDPPDLNSLTQELLTGAIAPWMLDAGGGSYNAAKVLITVLLSYSGSDANTLALFTNNPDSANTYVFYVAAKVTDADTGTYKRLASAQAQELPPAGLAQQCYLSRCQLHYEGQIELTEQECSGLVPPGHNVNISGGNGAWTTMAAQLVSTVYDIDKGTTKVQVGPPQVLGVRELFDMWRAIRIRQPAWNVEQQQTGSADGNTIDEHKHAHHSSHFAPAGPGGGSTYVGPFSITTGKNTDGSYWALINLNSNLWPTSGGSSSNIPITGLNTKINLDPNDTFWLLGTLGSDGVTVTAATIHNFGAGYSDYSPSAADWTSGGEVEHNSASPSVQALFRRQIATFVADGTGTPQLAAQRTTTDLRMCNVARAGLPAVYPWPN